MVKIGSVEITGRFTLAPMAGVSDFAFRAVCREQGAALTTTEMVSAKALVYKDEKTKSLLYVSPEEHPCAVQIFGHEPEIMAEAAGMALGYSGADILDINMGCPVGKVVKSGDGSALMKSPELAGRIIEAVVAAVDKPVTVKFRKGWDNGSVNAVEFAKICEQAGASAIAVHGRTRADVRRTRRLGHHPRREARRRYPRHRERRYIHRRGRGAHPALYRLRPCNDRPRQLRQSVAVRAGERGGCRTAGAAAPAA